MIHADWDAIRRDVDAAPHGMKRAVVERHAERLGCSYVTVYRNIKPTDSKRKKGRKRAKQIPQSLVERVAEVKARSRQLGLGERELSTELVIKALVDMGVDGAEDHLVTDSGRPAVSSVNRRLREAGHRQRQPYRLVEAEAANEEHQLDWSRSKYFQLRTWDEGRGDYLLEVAGKSLHYKQAGARLRTWLVQVKDSYSRLRLIRMYAAAGESALLALDFLGWCWTREPDAHPMRYLPGTLKLDNGATARRKEFRAMCEALGVEIATSTPYNSRSQGKVESAWKSLWQRFELDLATRLGDGGTVWMADYNALVHEHLAVEDAGLAHPVHRGSRLHAYATSVRAYPPRETDADVVRLACRADVRKVSMACTVSIDGQKWEAPEEYAGQRVVVHQNAAGELVGEPLETDGKPFRLTPFFANQRGDFRGPRDVPATRAAKDVAVDLARPLGRPQETTVRYLPPEPVKVEPTGPFAEAAAGPPPVSATEARALVNRRLRGVGLTYDDLAEVFDPLVTDNATAAELDAVCTEVLRRRVAQ